MPPNTERLLQLADRIEASEPSFALDLEIALAAGGFVAASSNGYKAAGFVWRDDSGQTPPPYTTSLEAAVGLVPEGWGCELVFPHSPRAKLWSPDGGPLSATHNIHGHANHPAMALCAAALRARATING